VLAATFTGAVVAALSGGGPVPGDAPAHLYRTLLVHQGAVIWDNLWYAGHYPLASYSVLYYFPAALVGNTAVVVVGALASAVLFTAIAHEHWGSVAKWPARAFAVLAAAPLFTGLYSYSLGFASLLAALRVLQRGRRLLALALAAVTIGLSPLAFAFLCLVLVSLLFTRARRTRGVICVGVGLTLIAGAEALILLLFPAPGVYPFSPVDLLAVLTTCVFGATLARRAERRGFIEAFFLVWGLGSIVAFSVPSAVGDNWTRLRAFVFPLMLIAAVQARFRPRPLAALALTAAFAYNLVPYLLLIPYRLDGRPAQARFWRAAIAFVQRHGVPDYRVEVVPTASHWESYWFPRAGVALARGWYRQLDQADNPVLYRSTLDPRAYRRWLRLMGVAYVVVPRTKLDPAGGQREARLVESARGGLRLVYAGPSSRIYRLAHPTPLVTGAAASSVLSLQHEALTFVATRPGRYFVRVRFNPYWKIQPAAACIHPGARGMTAVTVRRAGVYRLSISSSLDGWMDALTARDDRRC
jgi:hypothetical protein